MTSLKDDKAEQEATLDVTSILEAEPTNGRIIESSLQFSENLLTQQKSDKRERIQDLDFNRLLNHNHHHSCSLTKFQLQAKSFYWLDSTIKGKR